MVWDSRGENAGGNKSTSRTLSSGSRFDCGREGGHNAVNCSIFTLRKRKKNKKNAREVQKKNEINDTKRLFAIWKSLKRENTRGGSVLFTYIREHKT